MGVLGLRLVTRQRGLLQRVSLLPKATYKMLKMLKKKKKQKKTVNNILEKASELT